VTRVSVRDLEEDDALELPQNVEPNNVSVEALDTLEVFHSEYRLAQRAYSGVHERAAVVTLPTRAR
jgi:hypothetical protein